MVLCWFWTCSSIASSFYLRCYLPFRPYPIPHICLCTSFYYSVLNQVFTLVVCELRGALRPHPRMTGGFPTPLFPKSIATVTPDHTKLAAPNRKLKVEQNGGRNAKSSRFRPGRNATETGICNPPLSNRAQEQYASRGHTSLRRVDVMRKPLFTNKSRNDARCGREVHWFGDGKCETLE